MNNQTHNLSPHLKKFYDFGYSGVLHLSVKADDGELREKLEGIKEGDEVELEEFYGVRGEVNHRGIGFFGDAVGHTDEGEVTVEYLVGVNIDEREHILCLSDYILHDATDLKEGEAYYILGSQKYEEADLIEGLASPEVWHHTIDTGNGLHETVRVERCYLTENGDYTLDPEDELIKEKDDGYPTYKVWTRPADADKFDFKDWREFAPPSIERFIKIRALIDENIHNARLVEIGDDGEIKRFHLIFDDTTDLPHHISELEAGDWVKFASCPDNDFQVVGFEDTDDGETAVQLNFYKQRIDKLGSAARYDWRIYQRIPEFAKDFEGEGSCEYK